MAWFRTRWPRLVLGLLGLAIILAALGPADRQFRFGLHWLIEHFIVFFVLTTLACAVTGRPMLVAAVLVPFAVGLEAAQGLTVDRAPDIATALVASGAIAFAALLAEGVRAWQKNRCKGRTL